jgi:carboxymethylenebutenolidase
MLDIIYILVSMLVNRKQTSINRKKKKSNNNKRHKRYSSLGAVFDKHIKCEFQDHGVDATMKTMVREPYVHHVPGGVGYDAVYDV